MQKDLLQLFAVFEGWNRLQRAAQCAIKNLQTGASTDAVWKAGEAFAFSEVKVGEKAEIANAVWDVLQVDAT